MRFIPRGNKQPRHPAPIVSAGGSSWENLPQDASVYPTDVPNMEDTQTINYEGGGIGWVDLRTEDSMAETEMIPRVTDEPLSFIDIPAAPTSSVEDAWAEKLKALPGFSITLQGRLPIRQEVVTDPDTSQTVESFMLDMFADTAMNNAGDGEPRTHHSGKHIAMMLMIDPARYLLTIGSTMQCSWVLPMATSADETLLSVGFRRDSSWEWMSGFLSCDIVCDD